MSIISNSNFGALSIMATSMLQTSDITAMTTTQVGALSSSQLAVLSEADLQAFSSVQISSISLSALQSLSPRQLGNFTTTEIGELTSTQIGGLTSAQLASMSQADLQALATAQNGSLTRSQIESLSSTGVQTLTSTEIQGFSAVQLAALNVSFLSATQVAGLSSATIGNLSVGQFRTVADDHLASLSAAALSGVTLAQYNTLSTLQLASLLPAQNAALATPALAEADIQEYGDRGSITYTGMLSLLQSDAVGGMTAAKFGALQDIDSDLDVRGGLTTSAYVAQIADDVIAGDSANKLWNGGSYTTSLGDLSANSTASQVDDLIGKWFLGTDMPQVGDDATYQASTLPLYGSSGAPTAADVTEGDLGDGYLMASLAEVARQNPSAIQSMITSNGNGTYSVDFDVNGVDDYVTVNNELPVMASNAEQANGSDLEYANGAVSWAPLIEKAYAELNEQTGVPGNGTGIGENSYAAIAGGLAYPLTEITGQSTQTWALSGMSTSAQTTLASTLASTFAANGEVLLSSTGQTQDDLVGSQMFEVTAFDDSTDTLTLQNPSTPATQNGAATSFTESIAQLVGYGASLYTSSPPPPPVSSSASSSSGSST